jgi:hypothetical protein
VGICNSTRIPRDGVRDVILIAATVQSMTLIKRPKKWASPRSPTIDDEVHDYHEEPERCEKERLQDEVRKLKKEKVCSCTTFLRKSDTFSRHDGAHFSPGMFCLHWAYCVCF